MQPIYGIQRNALYHGEHHKSRGRLSLLMIQLHAERPVKTGGVRRSQDAKGNGRPSTNLTRHGRANAQGTAQDTLNGMVESVSGIVRQLRVFTES